MQQFSDDELMCKYKEGDTGAMEELFKRYQNRIYHFAWRLSRNSSEARDIIQEVFMRLHANRQKYIPQGKFSTWIFSIAHNACVSALRKNRFFVSWPYQKDNPEELKDYASLDPSPATEVTKDDMAALVKKHVQSLPFLQKEAIVLREYEKLSYEEIGKILNKPQGTVKILIYRARQSLKEKLLPYMQDSEGGLL